MSIGRDLDGAVPRKHLDDNGTAQLAQVAPQIQVLYYTDRPGPNASIVLRADFSFTLFLLLGPEHNYEMRASGNSRFHRVFLPSRIADNMLWWSKHTDPDLSSQQTALQRKVAHPKAEAVKHLRFRRTCCLTHARRLQWVESNMRYTNVTSIQAWTHGISV
jgi:hypothetical protein